MKNVEFLGQVFTTNSIVEKMLTLIKNKGSIMEPSCGDGAFFNQIKSDIDEDRIIVGIEYDSRVCPDKAINMDFFDYNITNQFDTIIGNPPYVKYQNISEDTKSKLDMSLFDERSNLYLFFIEKCIKHLTINGELIFIVPRDFIKSSSSIKLNKFIYSQGTITDWIDLGDELIFPGFSPNCVIFRFVKNDFTRKTNVGNELLTFKEINGQIIFTKNEYPIDFSKLFSVKVGAASGLDLAFTHENGNCEFVFSETKDTNKTKRMFYNINSLDLLPMKELLLNRKIKKFSEKNWYMWGRGYFNSNEPRIYVNVKTRKKNPFFLHNSNAYDGSILAIFPKFKTDDKILREICNQLNDVNWSELGFMCDGRYLFGQKSLEQITLPESFKMYENFIDIK